MRIKHSYRLLIIALAGLLLRVSLLGSKSLWLDEAFSVWMAKLPVEHIWSITTENHPPLYYLTLKTWMVLGDSEAIVRLPSALISVISFALLYLLARRLLDERAAIIAVSILALSPLDFWYAQEARMYIFVAASALIIALGLSMMGARGALLIFMGLSLGLYFDYTTIPIWVMLSAIWLDRWWRDDRPTRPFLLWLGASFAAWLLYVPWWSQLQLVLERMSGIFVIANIREYQEQIKILYEALKQSLENKSENRVSKELYEKFLSYNIW